MASVIAANTKFSLDLFKNISESKKTDSIFYSPLSISSALAMVYMGAQGNTATEMSECPCQDTSVSQHSLKSMGIPGDRLLHEKSWTGPLKGINPAAAPVSAPLCKKEQEEHCQSPTK